MKIDWREKETNFRAELASKRNLRIVEMNADGNCLFNAISHQIYGTQDFHQLVREKCMEYILAQKAYFQAFITDEETIEQYCHRKSTLGVWGDDVEIQALSEIYDRSIEIMAYSSESLRTFHEQQTSNSAVTSLKLSYHGQQHYNSVVDTRWTPAEALESGEPGAVENEAIEFVTQETS